MIKIDIAENYVFSKKISEIISLGINSEKNVLLHGPAGHGKSEMSVACVRAAGLYGDCFIQSFGEGMDESRMYGGVNYEVLEKEFAIEYNTDRSFLVHKVAIFEEIFDAPAIVLQSVKDTLTSKYLRNGAQQVEMQTKCIIACTNVDPTEISEISPSAHALVERFPLQLKVEWEEYDQASYYGMFNRVHPDFDKDIKQFLARLVEKANEQGNFISPRTAIHALELLMLYNSNNGSSSDDDYEHYTCLEYIPGFEGVISDIAREVKEIKLRKEAEKSIRSISRKVTSIKNQVSALHDDNEDGALAYLKLASELKPWIERLNDLAVPDNLVEKRQELMSSCQELLVYLQDIALNTVGQ